MPSAEELGTVHVSTFRETIGSFSNDDDSDGSENVTFKINSRFLKRSRIHSVSLKMSKVSEFP